MRGNFYRLERDRLVGVESFVAGSLELAVDGDVGVLVETGVGFEAGFGRSTTFDNREIMVKEAESPFEGFAGMSMLQSVGLALCLLDEFTICYAGCRPGLREMVGIELEKALGIRHSADNDVLFVAATCFDGIHRAPVGFIEGYRHKIAHSSGARCGMGRERDVMVNNAA